MFRMFPLAAAAALLSTPALACDGFSVHDAYARSSTSMSTSGAAFMVLVNDGDSECHVTGVQSDVARRTELHTHIQNAEGVMRMVEVEDGFIIPAHGQHALARGGDHVMFMGLNAPFEQDALLPVTLIFADGTQHAVEIPVDLQRQPGQGPQGHGQMQGHDN